MKNYLLIIVLIISVNGLSSINSSRESNSNSSNGNYKESEFSNFNCSIFNDNIQTGKVLIESDGSLNYPTKNLKSEIGKLCSFERPLEDNTGKIHSIKYFFKYKPAKNNAPTIIFISGGPGQGFMGEKLNFAHTPEDIGIILIDPMFVGYNLFQDINAKDFSKSITSENIAHDITLIIKSTQLNNYIIYGISYGTFIATITASKMISHPPLAVILEGTVGKSINEKDYINGFLNAWNQYVKNSDPALIKKFNNRITELIQNNSKELSIDDFENMITSAISFRYSYGADELDRLIKKLTQSTVSEESSLINNILDKDLIDTERINLILNTVKYDGQIDFFHILGKDSFFSKEEFKLTTDKIIDGIRSFKHISSDGINDYFHDLINCKEFLADGFDEKEEASARYLKDLNFISKEEKVICKDLLEKSDVQLYDSKKYQVSAPIFYMTGENDHNTPYYHTLYHFENQKIKTNKHILLYQRGSHNSFFHDNAQRICKINFWNAILKNPFSEQAVLETLRPCLIRKESKPDPKTWLLYGH